MVNGLTEMIGKLGRIRDSVVTGGGDILEEIGNEIMVVAKARTPYLSGTLRDSGEVSKAEITGNNKAVVYLSFGGDASEYTVYVHEDLDAHHKAPGQAKFLESALQESVPFVGEKISFRMMQIWQRI